MPKCLPPTDVADRRKRIAILSAHVPTSHWGRLGRQTGRPGLKAATCDIAVRGISGCTSGRTSRRRRKLLLRRCRSFTVSNFSPCSRQSFIYRFSPFKPPFRHRSNPRHLPFLTVQRWGQEHDRRVTIALDSACSINPARTPPLTRCQQTSPRLYSRPFDNHFCLWNGRI